MSLSQEDLDSAIRSQLLESIRKLEDGQELIFLAFLHAALDDKENLKDPNFIALQNFFSLGDMLRNIHISDQSLALRVKRIIIESFAQFRSHVIHNIKMEIT